MAVRFAVNRTSCLAPPPFTRSHNPPLSLPIINSPPTFTRSHPLPVIHSLLKRYTPSIAALASEPNGPVQLGLDSNNNDTPMILVVQGARDGSIKCNVLSTENNSFRAVQSGKHLHLPNLSRLTDENFEILSSCNPWMLVSSSHGKGDGVEYLLWDLSTDELKALVDFPVETHLLSGVRDHSGSLLWGIGFDSVSEEYKLVFCLKSEYAEDDEYPNHDRQADIQAYVMSLKTCLWKEIRFPHQPDVGRVPIFSLHINGVYYWVAHWQEPYRYAIIPFDTFKGEFPAALIPMPPTDKGLNHFNIVLAECHGSLAVVVHDFRMDVKKVGFAAEMDEPFGFEIWVWNEGGSWSLKATAHIPTSVGVTKVMGLFKNDKLLLLNSKGELLLYDCVTNDRENLGISGCDHFMEIHSLC